MGSFYWANLRESVATHSKPDWFYQISNFNEPMGAPAIFEKQIEIKLLHPASTMESRIQDILCLPKSQVSLFAFMMPK
ncbi:MAG: hypothetical protein P8X79_09000 [Reinekea sp.]